MAHLGCDSSVPSLDVQFGSNDFGTVVEFKLCSADFTQGHGRVLKLTTLLRGRYSKDEERELVFKEENSVVSAHMMANQWEKRARRHPWNLTDTYNQCVPLNGSWIAQISNLKIALASITSLVPFLF